MLLVKDLCKQYTLPDGTTLHALKNVNLQFRKGEFIAILGSSGSGKSTLLNMISGVDSATSGIIELDGKNVAHLSDSKWRKIRNKKIGFVFQRFNLIEHLTILENVTLPLLLTGTNKKLAEELAMQLLEQVELADFAKKSVKLLSGGQMQRVAMARTLIINPSILLADEPTGALDSSTGVQILKLMQSISQNRTIIMVTHDEKLAYEYASRVIRLDNGEIISDEVLETKLHVDKQFAEKQVALEGAVEQRVESREQHLQELHIEKQPDDFKYDSEKQEAKKGFVFIDETGSFKTEVEFKTNLKIVDLKDQFEQEKHLLEEEVKASANLKLSELEVKVTDESISKKEYKNEVKEIDKALSTDLSTISKSYSSVVKRLEKAFKDFKNNNKGKSLDFEEIDFKKEIEAVNQKVIDEKDKLLKHFEGQSLKLKTDAGDNQKYLKQAEKEIQITKKQLDKDFKALDETLKKELESLKQQEVAYLKKKKKHEKKNPKAEQATPQKKKDSKNMGLMFDVTSKNESIFKKEFKHDASNIKVGQQYQVELKQKYKSNSKFTKLIAKKNYKQNRKVNTMILISLVISLSLLLSINLLIKNLALYNYSKFSVMNDYHRTEISNYEDTTERDAILTSLSSNTDLSEYGTSYEYYVFANEMYLVQESSLDEETLYSTDNTDGIRKLTSIDTTNNVSNQKIVTLPSKVDNFNLKDEILHGSFPDVVGEHGHNQVLVTSEFLLSRFYGISMSNASNSDAQVEPDSAPALSSLVGSEIYICATNVYDEELTLGEIKLDTDGDMECINYRISGIINSYYTSSTYAGNIYMPKNGFYDGSDASDDNDETDFEEYFSTIKSLAGFEQAYDESIYVYFNEFTDVNNQITSLKTSLEEESTIDDITVRNELLADYNEMVVLQNLMNYTFLFIIGVLVILSGTINFNIVSASVNSRIREIGIYSCIGVSKKSLRNMFIFETTMLVIRLILLVGASFGLIVGLFYLFYNNIIVDLSDLNQLFGENHFITYDFIFSGSVLGGSVLLLYIFVLIPSFRAANLKAIDALKS